MCSTDSMRTFKCYETTRLPTVWVSSVIPTLQITTRTCAQRSRKNWRLRPSEAMGAPQAFLLLQKMTSSCQTKKSRGCDCPVLPDLCPLSRRLLGHAGREEGRGECWLGTGTGGACWHVSSWLVRSSCGLGWFLMWWSVPRCNPVCSVWWETLAKQRPFCSTEKALDERYSLATENP